MIKVLKKIIKNLMFSNISHKDLEKTKVLLAHNIVLNKRSLKLIDDFADVEFSCFSKFGERAADSSTCERNSTPAIATSTPALAHASTCMCQLL